MSIPRWTPPQTLSPKESKLLARHKRTRKLFGWVQIELSQTSPTGADNTANLKAGRFFR